MNKLFQLHNELKDNAGPPEFGSVLSDWFRNLFGSWRGWFASVLGIIALIILIFWLIICCIIPCFRSLAVRAIASWFTQMTVMVDKNESKIGLTMSYGNDEALEMIQVISNKGQDGSGGEPDSNGDMWELGDQTTSVLDQKRK